MFALLRPRTDAENLKWRLYLSWARRMADWAKIGLIKAGDDVHGAWAEEVMDSSGLPYSVLTDFSTVASYDVLVLFGRGRLSPQETLTIKKWTDLGNRLIACGSTWGLDDLFGVKDVGLPPYSKGKLVRPAYNDRLWPEGCQSVVFFGGQRVSPGGGRIVSRDQTGSPLVVRNSRCTLIAPHLGQTMTTILLGRSVESDGIGPGDGTVTLEDGVRRAEDGTNLSFESDRSVPERCAIPLFATAHVDVLLEVFSRALFEAVESCGKLAVATWRWPSNFNAVSTVTVDCESNDPDEAMQVHRALESFGQKASWLVPIPGFSSDVYRRIKDWGDSIGLLYDLVEQDKASDTIRHQALVVSRAAGVMNLPVVRPKDGCWRGLKSPYSLANQIGSAVSVAKGGVQPGSSGFLFGSSRLFFPVFPEGRRSEVAELPYSICRPGIVTESRATSALVEETLRVSGCVHTAVGLKGASEQEFGLIDLLRRVRENKLGSFTADELVNYEKARRSLTIDPAAGSLKVTSAKDVKGLTLMVIGGGYEALTCGRRYPSVSVRRHGALVSTFVIGLEAKTPALLKFEKTMVA